MDASIIVCTYNRADALRLALDALARVESPQGFTWEVLLVDNRSTDETPQLCQNFASEHNGRFVYVREERPGKSFALNTGIRQARGSLLIFTDDDCVAEPTWLQKIIDELASDPDIAILGGRVELYNPQDLPLTLITSRHKTTVSKPLRFMFPRAHVIGCNVAIKREVFETIGLFDPNLGPGSRGQCGEDFDLFLRALSAGFKIAYSPLPVVRHNHGRRTATDQARLMATYHVSRGALYALRWRDRGVRKIIRFELLKIYRDLRYNFGDWALYREHFVRSVDMVKGALKMMSPRKFPSETLLPQRRDQMDSNALLTHPDHSHPSIP